MPIPAEHWASGTKNADALDSVLRLLRHPHFRAALDELHDSTQARASAEKDGTAFFRQKGIHLPSGATVSFRNNNWFLGFNFGSGIRLGYDSTSGWIWPWSR
jgi:hypothetical protein